MASKPLLTGKNLHRWYGRTHALRGLDIHVCRGEVLGVLGLNGAGKSTALKLLCGVLAPDRGQILINDVDLERRPIAAKKQIGYLPQIVPVYPDHRVDEYLRHCAWLRRVPARRREERLEDAATVCGLTSVLSKRLGSLSGGYIQRVGIAQAIVHQPAVIVLDEPCTGLDPAQIIEIRHLIRNLAGHAAIVLSTHILSEVHALCDRVLIIHDGRGVYDAPLRTSEAVERQPSGVQTVDAPSAIVQLGLRSPPPLATLKAQLRSTQIVPLAPDRFEVTLSAQSPTTEQIGALAARHQWRLYELHERPHAAQSSNPHSLAASALETRFLALTVGLTDDPHRPAKAPRPNCQTSTPGKGAC